MKKAILFDFDGTLADGFEMVVEIFRDIAPDYVDTSIDPHTLRGLSAKTVIKRLGIKRRDIPRLLVQGRKKMASRIPDLKLFEGIHEQLTLLKQSDDIFMGIVSSNSTSSIKLFLSRNDLDAVFDVVIGDVSPFQKSRVIRKIVHTYSLTPSQTLYVGDEARDIEAAQKAGIQSLAVGWGFNTVSALEEVGVTTVIYRPSELASSIRKLLA